MADREALLATLVQELSIERERLREQLDGLGSASLATGEFDSNFADSSQVTAERGELEALRSSLEEQIKDVERALSKVPEGRFGVCELCSNEIAEERLEAMPTARYCIVCANTKSGHR
ncbi:transcriptional regulator, TraR/DksA family [Ferrithrix thermotolerans DSM 19514]|jgi:DnaK suppressor protein|uniref:Transcriptional regulator, TraR/DksA family n=1 Tax=Ferrithrix thermotolerans DSM 19514 TaxID=1121881 RepID=A0A1M4XAS6_9ACTN|nr:TraR/DksA C4-type zinc finger protein [Ferrithrix thermotolerans]SHE90629.1 transcriptional regulator, TraR/DksA family [Ferrithrix thermotolerans DSM 19514]